MSPAFFLQKIDLVKLGNSWNVQILLQGILSSDKITVNQIVQSVSKF